MKKLFAFIAIALLLGGGIAFAYNDGLYPNNKDPRVGSPDVAPRVYTLVRYAENNANGTSLSEGEVVVMDSISDDGVTVGRAGVCGSADSVVGVVVSDIPTADNAGTAATSLGSRNWGYVQIYGLNSGCNVKSTCVAGQAIMATADGYYAEPFGSVNTAHRNGSVFGYVLDAVSTTATDTEVFIVRR